MTWTPTAGACTMWLPIQKGSVPNHVELSRIHHDHPVALVKVPTGWSRDTWSDIRIEPIFAHQL